ncbi:AraC family transcriptional regulator [Achromobacter aloeverae]|uniref:AraC family transcriptional regulator n=1 Tax=Achromobacter aloeverae TaxID=1750518 RepID=A0A4Q1HRC6_9BURK|nr:AraC family transcriptional regulator [Achromobacter aloeverae]RXN93539.1 AraC family transcriptional regulator [Achromobacter aloeverae]
MTTAYALAPHLISELLTGMRLRGVRYKRVQTGPSFGLSFAAKAGHGYFHYLAVGSALLRTDDGTLHEVSAGNAVFLPHGQAHQWLSTEDAHAQDIEALETTLIGNSVTEVDTCPSTSTVPSAIFFYGCMEFDLGGMRALGQLMPNVMCVNADSDRYPGLIPILSSMKGEICSRRVGYADILARLAEVVATMIVRGWIECGCDNASGMAGALRDPRLARAILALHRQPARDWKLAELADECHISRSVFAKRFHATVGTPPLRYATELKMRLARQWLTYDRLSIDSVAERLGYSSQAAFSRAFKRVTGLPPGSSRSAD